jgi:transcriptional regulator with XRE-family HTH domain
MSLRDLASVVNVGYTYLSKVENGRLDFGDFPSESLIHRLAEALDADEDELLLLAEKIPEKIKTMVLKRPDAFLRLAELNGRKLDQVLRSVGGS